MPGRVVRLGNEGNDAEPPRPVKHAKVAKAPKVPATKRKRPGYISVNGVESENESSASSEQSGSDYAPHDTSEESNDSDENNDNEGSPTPYPKRVKKTTLDPLLKRSTPSKLAPPRETKQPRKQKKDSDKSATLPDSVSLGSEGVYTIPRGERNELVNNLTRERAKRLLEAIELPQAHELSPDERCTARQILTRGCMPAIPRHWEKDFSTLPESLFFSGMDDEPEHIEGEFILEADKGTEFYAIRAFQELLKISGIVRDHCNILETSPEISIKRAIERYLRWALSDAHVRALPNTTPVHLIYCKKKREGAKSAFDEAFKCLESLASTWRGQIPASKKPAVWPSLMGFVVCGPVLSVVTLDCNPNPQTETQGMRILGQFDLSDFNNDVWNTLAIAISVMHIKRTMTKLAQAYKRPFIAPIFEDETKCSPDMDI